jgi:hypothetical protein
LEPLLEKLKSAFYEAEDILDRVEYQRLKKQIRDARSSGSKLDLLKRNLRSAMPSDPLKDEVHVFSFVASISIFLFHVDICLREKLGNCRYQEECILTYFPQLSN